MSAPGWRALRRFLAFSAAPRLLGAKKAVTRNPNASIHVAGFLSTASGLGESARLCIAALRANGYHVVPIDLSGPLLRQPRDLAYQAPPRRRIPPGATVILHVNPPVFPLALLLLGRRTPQRCHIIGYWAWELPTVPREWRRSFAFVDELWVPSAFTADALKQASRVPITVVPHCIHRRQSASPGRESSEVTVLCLFNMASSFARKNPLAAVRAFEQAFADSATPQRPRLRVKLVNAEANPEAMAMLRDHAGPAVSLDDSMMDRSAVWHLIDSSDIVISLHRSEGFGLVLAEAMLAGKPVISTDWSATAEFIDQECGMPVPFRLTPARDPQGLYDIPETFWADADIDAAAEALRKLAADPALRHRLGAAGRRRIEQRFSTAAYGRAVIGSLGSA